MITDAVEMLDRHIKENTANGNMHPGENWYERDFREAENMIVRFSDLNWQGLKNIFADRSQIWQEACVFILGEANTEGSLSMLGDIFLRGTDGISCYSAIFLSAEDMRAIGESERELIRLRADELLQDDLYKNYGEHYQVTLETIREKLGSD